MAYRLTTIMAADTMIFSSLRALRFLKERVFRKLFLLSFCLCGLIVSIVSWPSSKMGFTNSYDLRLAILAVLRLQPCSLVILAPVCSGFSYMCSSQAKRFWFDPLGDETYEWVKCGNLMANRVILLCWLCSALGHVWLVEQPSSAKFGDLPRWRFFCEQVVYAIWMALAIYLGGTLHLYLFGFLFAVFAVFAENMYLLT